MKWVYLVYCVVGTCVCDEYLIMKNRTYNLFAWSVVQENLISQPELFLGFETLKSGWSNPNVTAYG